MISGYFFEYHSSVYIIATYRSVVKRKNTKTPKWAVKKAQIEFFNIPNDHAARLFDISCRIFYKILQNPLTKSILRDMMYCTKGGIAWTVS